jgi:DUF2905 family protein
MAMADLGKLLLTLGAVIAVVGGVLILAGKMNVPLGRLPGDIVYRGKNTVFYFPLATCLVISILLSLVLWLINRGRHWATSEQVGIQTGNELNAGNHFSY